MHQGRAMSGLLAPVAWIMDLTTTILTALKLTLFGIGSATFMGAVDVRVSSPFS